MPERMSSRPESRIRRRRFLTGAAATVSLIAAGVCAVSYNPRVPSTPEEIRDRLKELNPQIGNDPKRLNHYAVELSSMAVKFFCTEMGAIISDQNYDPSRMTGKIHSFEQRSRFEQTIKDFVGCTIEPISLLNEAGVSYIGSDEIYMNLQTVVNIPHLGQSTPASDFFAGLIHELHHAWPPTLPIDAPFIRQDSNMRAMMTIKRGLVQAGRDPEKSLPGKTCYASFRAQAEEAVVQHSTDMITRKVNYTLNVSPDYRLFVRRYESEIINKLFSGDHRPLLRFQQKTQDRDFFSSIGRVFTNDPTQFENLGDNIVYQVIIQGMRVDDPRVRK